MRFYAISSLLALVPLAIAAEPFIGKGRLAFSTYSNSGQGVFYSKVGCLQNDGLLTADQTQCAVFNGSQIVIPNAPGYPPLIYGNLTTGNNVCGVDAPPGGGYYFIKCAPGVDALSAYWGVSRGRWISFRSIPTSKSFRTLLTINRYSLLRISHQIITSSWEESIRTYGFLLVVKFPQDLLLFLYRCGHGMMCQHRKNMLYYGKHSEECISCRQLVAYWKAEQ